MNIDELRKIIRNDGKLVKLELKIFELIIIMHLIFKSKYFLAII